MTEFQIDSAKATKDNLKVVAKALGLKGYTKLKIAELLDLVKKDERVTDVPTSKSKKKVKEVDTKDVVKKPKFDKLNKKLEIYIDLEKYKSDIAKFPEDVSDEDILKLIEEDIKDFIKIDTLALIDFKKYVDAFDSINVLVEYLKHSKKSVEKLSSDEVYKVLATYQYKKDTVVSELAVKKIKKAVNALYKAKKTEENKAAKALAAAASKGKKKDESESEDSDSDDEKVPDIEDTIEEEDDE